MKTSVRFLAVLFAVVMALFVVGYAADYSDLDAKHENYDAIELLTNLNVLGGYEDGSFRPADPVQRDEMAKIVFIMATAMEDAGAGHKIFPDVSEKHWALSYISWAHSKSIVGGYEDGSFRPDANITYDEALKMACAMLGYTDFQPELWPADVRTVALKQLGLNAGLPADLTGDAVITRAQAAQIINNCFYKTMGTTKTVDGYYEPGYIAPDGNTPTKIPVKVEAEMTLAADVWGLELKEYNIVATQNFGLNHVGLNINAPKTDKADTVKVWDGTTVSEIKLADWGLDEYKGKTDDILGFTISEVYKDGVRFAASGLKGAKYDTLTIKWVGAKAGDAPIHASGSTYWFADRITVNGVVIDGEDYQNLRAATVDERGTFTVYDQVIWNNDTVGKTPPKPGHVGGIELNFNHYVNNSYYYKAWGIDSEGDGVMDFIFYKTVQPYKVTNVVDATDTNGAYQVVTVNQIKGATLDTNGIAVDSRKVVTAGAELKKGDLFMGIQYADKLYIDTVMQPQTGHATVVTGSSVTLDGVGNLSAISYGSVWNSFTSDKNLANTFFPELANDPISLFATDANGNQKTFTVWLYKNKVIWRDDAPASSTTEPEAAKTALLLYVDEKTEPQYNKATKKFEVFYPAYLLINGKEEVVNLDPDNAINGASGDYVSSSPEYTATVDSQFVLHYQYKLVTYEKDETTGFYSLKTADSSSADGAKVVVPVAQNPKLTYNAQTGYYKLVTDNGYFNVDVNEDTYLYYTYTKEATGDYKYVDFYTSEAFDNKAFNDLAFSSDVHLAYDAKEDFYYLVTGVLTGKLSAPTTGGSSVIGDPTPWKTDARQIKYVAESSNTFLVDGKTYYSYLFMDFATLKNGTQVAETTTTIADGAKFGEKEHFYGWNAQTGVYEEVNMSNSDAVSVGKITKIDAKRGIIYINATVNGIDFSQGYKLPEGVLIFAYKNAYEYQKYADLAALATAIEGAKADVNAAVGTYIDENGNLAFAWIIVDYVKADKTVANNAQTTNLAQ